MFVVELGLIFAVQGFREREGLNFVLLYAFAFVSGVTIGPIIGAYVSAGLGTVVLQAVAVTGVMTVGLSAYALTTKRSLMGLQPFLFMALLGLIVASIVNIFVGGTVIYTMLSWGGALLFSLLLMFDVQRAKYAPDTMGNAVVLTLGIYLDIVNLFLLVLRILQEAGAANPAGSPGRADLRRRAAASKSASRARPDDLEPTGQPSLASLPTAQPQGDRPALKTAVKAGAAARHSPPICSVAGPRRRRRQATGRGRGRSPRRGRSWCG
jgi:modulator of FtsH protease